ncbi:MAG: hypothetical protein LC798_16950 [Chloroflexi bacterium]|nr:hypothetical protein [Chloroflexota bacterium]
MPDARRASTPPMPTLFEGREVVDTVVKCSGTITHVFAKPPGDLRHGQIIIGIAVLEVDKVGFPRGDAGLVREHTIKVTEIHEFGTGEVEARRVLAEARKRTRAEVEARYGEAVPGEGIKTGRTDPQAEAKAARDRIRSIGDEQAAAQ